MKVLIADDEPMSLRILQAQLTRAGFEVVTAADGVAAINILAHPDAPQLVVMDWMMPRASGPEVCRWIRAQKSRYTYVCLVTARDSQADLLEALDCGCDDYVKKPYDPTELRARLRIGERMVKLEAKLTAKVAELEEAAAHIKQLQGLIPICMHCKRIRDDGSSWQKMESYIEQRSNAVFSHALCDSCLDQHYPAAGDNGATP